MRDVRKGLISLDNIRRVVLSRTSGLLRLKLVRRVSSILTTYDFTNHLRGVLFDTAVPANVRALTQSFVGRSPVQIIVKGLGKTATAVSRHLICINRRRKGLVTVQRVLGRKVRPPIVVFARAVRHTYELRRSLLRRHVGISLVRSKHARVRQREIVTSFQTNHV